MKIGFGVLGTLRLGAHIAGAAQRPLSLEMCILLGGEKGRAWLMAQVQQSSPAIDEI